jgi:serine/threonine protein kinase
MDCHIRVQHTNICRLFAYCTAGPNHCLVMELCTGRALDTRLACKAVGGQAPPPPLPWAHRVALALDIARALCHLHERRMIHRDLKVRCAIIQDCLQKLLYSEGCMGISFTFCPLKHPCFCADG